MKILLDACVPRPLRQFLRTHSVFTAQEMGWAKLTNGELLAAAEPFFEAFITSDQNLKYQQNLSTRKLAIMILPTNDWTIIRNHPVQVEEAVSALVAGAFVELAWG